MFVLEGVLTPYSWSSHFNDKKPRHFSRLNIDPRLDILADEPLSMCGQALVAKGRAVFGSIRSAYLGMIFVEYMI